ncbi:uncharacterized protein LOC136052965 [Cyrtonyx montezumae]|uniref:uncharacterized protein LOC136052965 n=1 Tax=Cyrtonyx montezumae TaxID=9017 RepID=UPI0032DA134C
MWHKGFGGIFSCISLTLDVSTYYQTELNKSLSVSIGKENLNCLQKKSVSSRDEVKYQTDLSTFGNNEIDEEASIQSATVHNEGHEATRHAGTEVSPEQHHPEDGAKCEDRDISWEGLRNNNTAEDGGGNCSDKEENITQPENGKTNEEFEEEERKQEICKPPNVDEEESVQEPYTDRMSCNNSYSGEPSSEVNDDEAQKKSVSNEMKQHTAENKCETYRSNTEGVETTTELCEMPEV